MLLLEHKNELSVALMKLINTRNIEDLVAHNGTDNYMDNNNQVGIYKPTADCQYVNATLKVYLKLQVQ